MNRTGQAPGRCGCTARGGGRHDVADARARAVRAWVVLCAALTFAASSPPMPVHAGDPSQGSASAPAASDTTHLRSVALLWSRNGCAPAVFVRAGTLHASASAIENVCVDDRCRGAKVYIPAGDGSGTLLRFAEPNLTVVRRVESLDVAALTLKSPDIAAAVPAPVVAPRAGAAVRVLGFGDCESLSVRHGVIGRGGAVEFATTVPLDAATRGAIVVDDHGAVGIVRADAGYAPVWFSRLVPRAASAVRLGAAGSVLAGNEDSSLSAEMSLWNDAYPGAHPSVRQPLGPRGPLAWLTDSLSFRAGVAQVTTRALGAGNGREAADALAGSARLGLEFLERIPPAAGVVGRQAERLGVTYALQTRGLLGPALEPLDVGRLLDVVRTSAREPEQVAALVALIEREGLGSPVSPAGPLAVVAVAGVAALLIGVTVWGWSLGYVFRAARGGVIVRWLKTAVVAVAAWPASLLVFWLGGAAITRRRHQRAMGLGDRWTL